MKSKPCWIAIIIIKQLNMPTNWPGVGCGVGAGVGCGVGGTNNTRTYTFKK